MMVGYGAVVGLWDGKGLEIRVGGGTWSQAGRIIKGFWHGMIEGKAMI